MRAGESCLSPRLLVQMRSAVKISEKRCTNASGRRPLTIRAPLAARVGELMRWWAINSRAPLKAMALVAAGLLCAFCGNSQGVIANDATILQGEFGPGQYLTLTNSLQGRNGLFAIGITSNGGSEFTFSYLGIAEIYALYDVSPGVVIDPVFAAASTPLVSNDGVLPGSSVQTFLPGQSRYYGYWDDRPFDSGIIYGIPDVADNYGWVRITRTVSGLQVSGSATALGHGIIAGTFTQVPEPSTGLLLFLGLGFFALRLNARLSKTRQPTPVERLRCSRLSLTRRGCTVR